MPKRGTGTPAFNSLQPGMIIAVKRNGDSYALRSVPEVSGGLIVEAVATCRILAMQGGWHVRGSVFNRATQAKPQPASTFKPIDYSSAIACGMTTDSILTVGPFCVCHGSGIGNKSFRIYYGH